MKVGTALHIAASSGRLDVIEHLISQGAEVNKGNNDGMTPLHLAAVQNGHLDVVKVLLAGGASSDTGDIDGHTPLQFALFLGYRSIVDLFINHSYCKVIILKTHSMLNLSTLMYVIHDCRTTSTEIQ